MIRTDARVRGILLFGGDLILRGMKWIAAVQTALYFAFSLAWTLGDNRAELLPAVVMGWVLFAAGGFRLAMLFSPADKKYSAALCGLASAADMALVGAVLAFWFLEVGFAGAAEEGGVFYDIFMVAALFALAVAEAASLACALADGSGRDKER